MSQRTASSVSGRKSKPEWTDWECPECTADNIYDDGFTIRDELFCMYCGAVFEVRQEPESDPPRYRLVMQ